MTNDTKQLLQEFKRISKKGFIRGVNKGFGSIGLTFERELGKSPDSMYFPDYKSIEIKCTSRFSHYPLYLFTVAFDGPEENEILRIANLYGYPDKDFPDKKVIFTKLDCKYFSSINKKYNLILKYDEKEEKLFLCVYDKNRKLLEQRSYIYIETILNHLKLKIQNLALIYASQKKEKTCNFYRFYRIVFYKIKSKEQFLNLLIDGIIKVSLVSRISKSGSDRGRYRNKNLEFGISKDDLLELFDKVYDYNVDYLNNHNN